MSQPGLELSTLIMIYLLIDRCLSFTLAVLITGGNGANQSAEIYHPDRNSACVLPNIPDLRVFHTQDGSLMCGGDTTPRSCRRWNPDTGAWDLVTESLTEERWGHTSWTPADGSGTYLMGGFESITSELIDKDNGVTKSFYLKYRSSKAT